MPISREPITVPACKSVSPRAISDPAKDTNCPGETARRTSIASSPKGCVCSTIATASAPRGIGPPVAIGVAVLGKTGWVSAVPHAITSPVQRRARGRKLGGRSEIARSHCKSIDARTIERRHVDWRNNVPRQRTAERFRKLPLLDGRLPWEQCGLEALNSFLTRQDCEELILIDAVSALRQRMSLVMSAPRSYLSI